MHEPIKPFFTFYLDSVLRSRVRSFLGQDGIILPETYSNEAYDYIGNRLKRVYSKTNQYSKSFINTWTASIIPGFIVYASDGEDLHLYHMKKKRHITLQKAEVLISQGTRIMYYGNDDLTTLECYVTDKRAKDHSHFPFLKGLSKIDRDEIPKLIVSPFSIHVPVYKLNHLLLLARAPNYVQALDSVVSGRDIFNSKGEFVCSELVNKSLTRYVCPIKYGDCVVLDDLKQVCQSDVLVNLNRALVQSSFVQKCDLFETYFKGKNMRILGRTGLTKVSFSLANRKVRLDTFLPVEAITVFSDSKPFNFELLNLFLLSSYGHDISFTSEDISRVKSISAIGIATERYSSALTSFALQLRKTFFLQNDFGLIVIAPKGGLKTTVIEVLSEADPDIVCVDSDTYGRWVTSVIVKSGASFIELNCDKSNNHESYFETLSNTILDKSVDKLDALKQFAVLYAKTLSDPEYGVGRYQDAIFDAFSTTKVLLFAHTTVEANLMSGRWQQIVIRPIHDTYRAVKERRRDNFVENDFLHHAYKSMTPTSNRACVNWAEFLLVVNPTAINVLKNKYCQLIDKKSGISE